MKDYSQWPEFITPMDTEINPIYSDHTTLISADLLDKLEKTAGVVVLSTVEEFLNSLSLDRAILYFQVDWSGPELLSRHNIFKALNDMQQIDLPVFKIDCSDQAKIYVVQWLAKQQDNKTKFYYGGWGETMLLNKERIFDWIANPGKLGYKKTMEKLYLWNSGGNI